MNHVTIEVLSAYPEGAWHRHLASELALLHPDAEIRVAQGLADSAFVWCGEFGLCEEEGLADESEPERTSIVEAFLAEGRSSFTAAALAAEGLSERVESEVKMIFRAWTRAGRAGRGSLASAWEWLRGKKR